MVNIAQFLAVKIAHISSDYIIVMDICRHLMGCPNTQSRVCTEPGTDLNLKTSTNVTGAIFV